MTDSEQKSATTRTPLAAPPHAEPVLTVFYDGACPLCSTEIGYYRRRRGAERLDWVDVSACPTEVVAPGLSRQQALKRFHVRDAGGHLVSGGQAFAVLWSALPAFAWIGWLFRARPLAWVIDKAYDRFLTWRPRLQALARRSAADGR
jgi:predicted DCC family thiol-disulfide oxidoreductase YuxK